MRNTKKRNDGLTRGDRTIGIRWGIIAFLALAGTMSAKAQNTKITSVSPSLSWTNSQTNTFCGVESTENLINPSWKPVSDRLWNLFVTSPVISVASPLDATTGFLRIISSTNPLAVDATTLDGKVMFGYQGWFGTPADGSPQAWWQHWSIGHGGPGTNTMTIDLWPDLSEYDSNELCATSLAYTNGAPACVYSAYNTETVHRHMRWLQDYSLDGVFLQRFVGKPSYDFENQVLENVMSGCECYHRVFVIMYDIVHANETSLVADITNDWRCLIDTFHITESPAYLQHDGKPIVAFCGIGYTNRPGTATQIQDMINWFRSEAAPKYQATLFGNVPASWRTLDGLSKTNAAWADVYRSFDVLSPWTVGAYSDSDGAIQFGLARVAPDIVETSQLGIDYMPVVFPGFSWHNLMATRGIPTHLNQIPRMGGSFLWTQLYEWQTAGANMLFIAMFDEVDEGTAMYKLAPTAADAPVGVEFVTLDADGYSLPSDWYLRLAREGKRMLTGQIAPTSNVPILP
ncbi:MAG: xylosidase/arabinosidase [Lentisphaerae bacterium]|nr:xylosidase/arabinosidase [Lentisphaerota bacterium]